MERLDAIGDAELRDALLFARSSARPVTADELAERQAVHRNVARGRLERLVQAGLLVPSFERRSGRSGPGAGRPAKTYAVGPELSALEFPSRPYASLLRLLLDGVPAGRLRALGEEFGRGLARDAELEPADDLPTALERVCAAMRSLGFQASVSADGAAIETPTCPLRPLVVELPDAAELDRGMWAGLVESALPGASVRCETRDCLDDHSSCRVRLELRRLTDAGGD